MSLNKHIIRIVAPLLIVLIAGAAFTARLKLEDDNRRNIGKSLSAVLETSVVSLRAWHDDQKTTVRLWAVDQNLRRLVAGLVKLSTDSAALKAAPEQQAIRDILTPIFKSRGLKGFFIIGPGDVNLASSRDANIGSKNIVAQMAGVLDRAWGGETIVSPPQKSDVPLLDVHGHMVDGLATMFSLTPLWGADGKVMALLAFRLDPDEGISLRLEWARVGDSGETYAVSGDGMLISESRFNTQLYEMGLIDDALHSGLNVRVADPGIDLTMGKKSPTPMQDWPLTHMARRAISGSDGMNLNGYRDYRGVEVVGAWVWLESLGYGVATEVEFSEAYSLMRKIRTAIILFAVFSSALLVVLLVVFERGRARLEENIRELDFQKFSADEHAIISSTDQAGNILEVNNKFCAISGFERDELIGKDHRMLKSGEHSPEFYNELWQTISTGNVWHGDIKNRRKDGSFYWVKATIVPFVNKDGRPFRYISIRTDITERTEATAKLQESKELLNVAIESISDGFSLFDENDRLVLSNRKFRNLHPAARDIIIPGVHFEDIIRAGAERGGYPEADGRVDEWVAERMALRKNTTIKYEYKNNADQWVQVSEQALPNGGRVGLRADITELKNATARADDANKAKSEFLSSMSHELRTPLNAILGFGQMLEFNPKEPLTEAQKSCTDHILKGGKHLLELINEVLDLAKIEAGHMDISMDDIRLKEIIDECAALIDGMAEARDIKVSIEPMDNENLLVRADYTRLKQVLLNLLSNAVKYNNDGGTIQVSCQPMRKDTLRINVIDTGPGISAEQQSELFLPFARLGAENTETEGTGIGLTITKQLIEMMDGNIGCDSEEGKGSTFWIDIPLSIDQEITLTGEVSGESGSTEELPEMSGRILYVEDNPANMELMELIVSRTPGLKMETADNAEMGVELARTRLPDVILMDINLSGMNGYQALEALKADDKTMSIPVIAVTANATRRDIEKGENAGFFSYIAKPVKVTEVTETIGRALEATRS
ncbi:MAG: PAS domain S-box protein [Rhodospirillaceae bacterium]|nr:PAS domain S-box protein [Rhodospirillaceae bacterium]MBT5014446.1 PAS domain S-box protein [Rhodospirillaceae bacterium]MBT5308386.1 PAS domain S-box protein [Rhodospirillaceae bacterium]MBT7356311.1 PAS domain S-box protein [Rhodospirillaceae bacterium]